MWRYALHRMITLIPLLLGVTLLSFLVMQLAPGNPLGELLLNPQLSLETQRELMTRHNLDKPILVQYLHWLWGVVHLDFGRSITWGAPVSHLIVIRAGNTLLLAVCALTVAWVFAIPFGVHAAVRQYSWSDKLVTTFGLLGMSIPNFLLALVLLYALVHLNISLPVGGATSIDYEWMTIPERVVDRLRHLAVPVIVLSTGTMAGLMRYMRGNLLDALRQDFITTARSKGLPESTVVWKHGVRNALNPLITIFGFQLGDLMSGYALTEIVIGWPGLGQLLLQAVVSKDYFLVMGGLVMSSTLLVLGNLVADLMLAASDPRIRYE